MPERGLTTRAQVVLTLSVLVLLSSGVVNVQLAVTESVLWPLLPGVGWPVVAAVLTGLASTSAPSGSDTRFTEPTLAGVARRG